MYANCLPREKNLPRVTKIFDAIASLCISQPSGEVIAVTLQTLPNGVKMIIAGNSDIPEVTLVYVHKIWDVLQQLSRDYAKIHGGSGFAKSPKRPKFHDLDKVVQERVQKLGRIVLRFTSSKFQRSVNKYFKLFAEIGALRAKELGFESIYHGIILIHKYLNKSLEPESLSNEDWGSFWKVLNAVESEINKLGRDPTELSKMFQFKFDRYITRVAAMPRHIKALLGAANSPTLRGIFQAKFSVVALKSGGKVQHTLPKTPSQWQHFIGIVLDCRNECDPHEQSFELNSKVVEAHCKSIHQHPFNPSAFVHCEAALMAYILNHPDESFYNYIGISKLCCRGCYALFQAIKRVIGRDFVVRGCHHKFYYPWKFPQIPEHHLVAQSMFFRLCYQFGQTYQGFRPATQQYLSDSEGASTPSETLSVDGEDDGLQLIFKQVTKGKTQLEFAFLYC